MSHSAHSLVTLDSELLWWIKLTAIILAVIGTLGWIAARIGLRMIAFCRAFDAEFAELPTKLRRQILKSIQWKLLDLASTFIMIEPKTREPNALPESAARDPAENLQELPLEVIKRGVALHSRLFAMGRPDCEAGVRAIRRARTAKLLEALTNALRQSEQIAAEPLLERMQKLLLLWLGCAEVPDWAHAALYDVFLQRRSL